MRKARDASRPRRIGPERARSWMEEPAVPRDRAGDDGEAFRMRGGDALVPIRCRFDPGGELGARLAAARSDVDARCSQVSAELREPGAMLGDKVEREPVPTGRNR